MSLKSRRRVRRLTPPELNPRAIRGAAPPVPQAPEEKRPRGGFLWRWREAARRILGEWAPEAERGGGAAGPAAEESAGEAVELSEAGTRLAVRSEAARLGGSLARSGWGLIGKITLAALAVAVLGLLAAGYWRPDFIMTLHLGPIGAGPPIPREAPSSLPYASSGLSKIEGAKDSRGPAVSAPGLAARRTVGVRSGAETARRLPSPTLAIEGGGRGSGGESALKAAISSSPMEGRDAGVRGLSSPPGGFFAPNAAPTNALTGFVSGDVNPGRHADPTLAQAVAPGKIDALSMGSLGSGRSEALGQLRSASSLDASMQRAGENETAAAEGQAQFDNPAQAAGVAGGGLAATGGGDGTGTGSVVNGPPGASSLSPGGASVPGGGMSREGSGGGLAACSDSNLSQCKERIPSAGNPVPGSPWQPLLEKAVWAVGVGEGLLIAASILALAGEMLGPYGWPLLMAAYVLATGAAALGAWAIDLGIQAHGMGALPERAWIDGALGGMLIVGAGGVFLGGPGAVAGLILGAVGLVGTIVASLLGKF